MRTGQPLRLFRDDHDGALNDDDVLAFVPDFALDDHTASLFGGNQLARYDQTESSADGDGDLNILAMEVAELLDAVDNGTPVEVGPEEGLAAVALVMVCHESSEAGRSVRTAEIVDGTLNAYQNVANREMEIEV